MPAGGYKFPVALHPEITEGPETKVTRFLLPPLDLHPPPPFPNRIRHSVCRSRFTILPFLLTFTTVLASTRLVRCCLFLPSFVRCDDDADSVRNGPPTILLRKPLQEMGKFTGSQWVTDPHLRAIVSEQVITPNDCMTYYYA
jgi:hypothetical protein